MTFLRLKGGFSSVPFRLGSFPCISDPKTQRIVLVPFGGILLAGDKDFSLVLILHQKWFQCFSK